MVVEIDGTEHPGDVEFRPRPIRSDLDPNDGDGFYESGNYTWKQSKPEILTNVAICNSDIKCQQ
jgi:hypothetical protein